MWSQDSNPRALAPESQPYTFCSNKNGCVSLSARAQHTSPTNTCKGGVIPLRMQNLWTINLPRPQPEIVAQDSQSNLIHSCHVTSVGLLLECLHLTNICSARRCVPGPLLDSGCSEAHRAGLVSRNIPIYRTVNVEQRTVTKLRIHRCSAPSLC